MTRKLYYEDAYLFRFDATVLACCEKEGLFEVLLDSTAFFPGGGGQPADKGVIAGTTRVSGLCETNGNIFHLCDAPLEQGAMVECMLDRAFRLANMRRHTGEHIFSGVTFAETGFDNVGFHIGEDYVTVDFNGEISRDTIGKIERLTNETVMACKNVHSFYPKAEELENLAYRSKKEIGEGVRIVAVEGCDVCACCGIHVASTGEVGTIKAVSCMKYKTGVRVVLKIASDALTDYGEKVDAFKALSSLLSVQTKQTVPAVEKLIMQRDCLHRENTQLKLLAFERRLPPLSGGSCFVFEDNLDPAQLGECCSRLCEKAEIAGVFSGPDGEIRYCLGSNSTDVRELSGLLNAACQGTGGGKPGRAQGKLAVSRAGVEAFLKTGACPGGVVVF